MSCAACRMAPDDGKNCWACGERSRATCAREEKLARIAAGDASLRVALATSQADVTRLAAELAESVRALAVSQGEVDRLRGAIHAASLEVDKALGLSRNGFSVELTLRQLGHALEARCHPTPTASPEPDRASPEVTVKETR